MAQISIYDAHLMHLLQWQPGSTSEIIPESGKWKIQEPIIKTNNMVM